MSVHNLAFFVVVLLAPMLAARAFSQTVVVVGDGQTLTSAQLAAGVFNGQAFTLSSDTTFEVLAGGEMLAGSSRLGYFDFNGSTINVHTGGELPRGGSVANANLNLFDGGDIGSIFHVYPSSVVNVEGGTIGSNFVARSGVTVNVSGGRLGTRFISDAGSVINIRGGFIGNRFLGRGGTINLFGSEFFLDGNPINLEPGQSRIITDRGDITLAGLLAEGSNFDLYLDPHSWVEDHISSGTTLTVTLVSEPSSLILLVTLVPALVGLRSR